MHIAMVNGSTRKNGATATILKKMQQILEQYDDVHIQYYDLIDYEINYCTGCRVCYRTGTCSIQSDSIEEVSAEIKRADAIIMGSSTFESYVTGILKSFWDRGHFVVEQSLYNTYGFSVVTYEIGEGNKARNAIDKFLLVSGGIRVGSLLKKLKFNEDPCADEAFVRKIEKRARRLYAAVQQKKRRTVFEFIFTKMVLIPLIWKPVFLKRRADYNGILDIWTAKGIL